jgi:hypothetical protein
VEQAAGDIGGKPIIARACERAVNSGLRRRRRSGDPRGTSLNIGASVIAKAPLPLTTRVSRSGEGAGAGTAGGRTGLRENAEPRPFLRRSGAGQNDDTIRKSQGDHQLGSVGKAAR